jgi:hypothetical protein
MSLSSAVQMLDMSVSAARLVMMDSKAPLQRRLSWLGSELERLAAEAYRLADEAGDDVDSRPSIGDPFMFRGRLEET